MTAAEQVVQHILADIEARLDPDHTAGLHARHRAALDYAEVDRLPLVLYLPYEGKKFAPYPTVQAFADPAKMMANELLVGFSSIYHLVDLKTDTPLCLRPNLGVTILASLFGARIELRGDEPPWVRPLGDLQAIQEIVDSPLPDVHGGLVPRALEQYAYFQAALSGFPRCQAALQLTLPDLQGPFDIAELLWGTEIFSAFYLQPDLLKALLDKITQALLQVYALFIPLVKEDLRPEAQYQHATAVKGGLLLRSDTATLISPAAYAEFIRPCAARLAQALGGIGVHFCGDGHRQVPAMLDTPGLQCLDFGQADQMDMDALYALAAPRRVALARLRLPVEELQVARAQQRFPTGVNLVCAPQNLAQARAIWKDYLRRPAS